MRGREDAPPEKTAPTERRGSAGANGQKTQEAFRYRISSDEATRWVARCCHGHLWNFANTYHRKDGRRNCRPCHAEAMRRYRARRREQAGRRRG